MTYKIKINLNLYSQTFSLYTKYTNIYLHPVSFRVVLVTVAYPVYLGSIW